MRPALVLAALALTAGCEAAPGRQSTTVRRDYPTVLDATSAIDTGDGSCDAVIDSVDGAGEPDAVAETSLEVAETVAEVAETVAEVAETSQETVAETSAETVAETIAEFAENADLIEMLRGLGVAYAQGWGVAQPQRVSHTPPV